MTTNDNLIIAIINNYFILSVFLLTMFLVILSYLFLMFLNQTYNEKPTSDMTKFEIKFKQITDKLYKYRFIVVGIWFVWHWLYFSAALYFFKIKTG